MTPAVTVLVTTFRHARFVHEALDSLAAQTSRDFDVIITDDASDDGTVDAVREWLGAHALPARVIVNQKNRGLCANRNTARAIANGEFLCSLSGDDVYEPERIARQIACFRQQPERVAAVYSDATVIDASGTVVRESFIRGILGDEPAPGDREVFRRLLRGSFFPAPAVMVRRSAIDAVGGYDESLLVEDWDMWLKLSARFDFRFLPGPLVRYRLVPTSVSHDPSLRHARLDSAFRTLLSWRGRAGDADSQVAEMLWQLATQALHEDDEAGAPRMLRTAAAGGRYRRRQALAWAANQPGGLALVRAAHRLYQSVAARVALAPGSKHS